MWIQEWIVLSALCLRILEGVPCNGHGTNFSGMCNCEAPFTGDLCQRCAEGYYGDPLNGGPCYKKCSRNDFLLTNFTFAGFGVQSESYQEDFPYSSTFPYCLWLVVPASNYSTKFLELSEASLHQNFNFAIQISSNSSICHSSLSENFSCNRQVVLIYNGLPAFLNVLGKVSSNQGLNVTTSQEYLFAALTGSQLRNTTLHVTSPYLTIVYYRSAKALNVGFSATIKVGDILQEDEISSCHCWSPSCDCENEVGVSIFLPSLSQAILSSRNSTADSHTHCYGRLFHTSTYDSVSNSVYLLGGVDLAGNVCPGDFVKIYLPGNSTNYPSGENGSEVVTVVEGEGIRVPGGRYHHATVLILDNIEENRSLLIIGGFIARGVASDEVWQFNISSAQWTSKSKLPVPIAAHTVTLTPGGIVVVIGGVSTDLAIQNRVMAYSVHTDSWEIWPHEILQISGVYGHTAAYDELTNHIWVFGGVAYDRSFTSLSRSVFSLHVLTRSWRIVHLKNEIYPRVFHSMVLIDRRLIIYGGLVARQPNHTIVNIGCSSDAVTLISLEDSSTDKAGKSSVTFSGFLPQRWGHTSTKTVKGNVVITGGSSGQTIETVDILHNINSLCTWATTESQCHSLSECVACGNISNSTWVGCFTGDICSELGLERLSPATPTSLVCGVFETCQQCLMGDVSRALDCTWCLCDNSTICTLPSDCVCRKANYTAPAHCILDVCKHSNCQECSSGSECVWLGASISRVMYSSNHDLLDVSTSGEWDCFSSHINKVVESTLGDLSLATCPIPCTRHNSCSQCVPSNSSHSGPLKCVWASYSSECMSEDSIPLLCVSGSCGTIVSTPNECIPSCSERLTCSECQSSLECSWQPYNHGQQGMCHHVTDMANAAIDKVECIPCPKACEEHGTCLSSGECLCNFGFVGGHCNVSCLCSGHGKCANETEVGRSTCLQCVNNTQGPNCGECKPFFVGSPDQSGGECSPCLEFCNGKSAVCVKESDFQDFFGRINYELLHSGPREDEVVCIGCSNNTGGNRCSQCLPGYFKSSHSVDDFSLSCVKCQCNGHASTCNNVTGDCDCIDNTITDLSTVFSKNNPAIRCNACKLGYTGNPLNNSQCYKTVPLKEVSNYTLRQYEAVFLTIGHFAQLRSGVQWFASFAVLRGLLDVYVTLNNSAIKYVKSTSGRHQIVITDKGQEVLSTSNKTIKRRRSMKIIEAKFKSQLDSGKIFRRDLFGNNFSPDNSETLKYRIEDRLGVLIDLSNVTLHREPFIAISALVNTTFYFNYVEYDPEYNPLIYLTVVLAIFVFLVLQILAVLKGIIFIRNQIDDARRKRRQGLSPKPMYSLQLMLYPKINLLRDSLEDLDKVNVSYLDEIKSSKNNNLSCYEIVPLTLQPTADRKVALCSIIVQGPATKSNRYQLSAGIGIVQLIKSNLGGQTHSKAHKTEEKGKIILQEIAGEATTEL